MLWLFFLLGVVIFDSIIGVWLFRHKAEQLDIVEGIKRIRDGEVDYKLEAVPAALVPEVVRQQISASFPQTFIVEWGKDDGGWKAELNNKLEIKFNRKLEMLGLDD